MRSRTAPDLAGRCPACRLRLERCLCDTLVPVPTRTQVVVVRHFLEQMKSTNTARLAGLVLPNLVVLQHGDPKGPVDLAPYVDGAWILAPGGSERIPDGPPAKRLIVLDGTWSQSRNMLARLGALRGVPQLSLGAPPPDVLRVRAADQPERMSTIEAIAGALEIVEPGEAPARLREAYRDFVARVRATRGL